MTTIAQPRVTVKWVQPAPQWDPKNAITTSPSLVEFGTDQFIQQFLAMMAGQQAVDLQPPKDSVQVDDTTKQKVAKLYQPFHQRYYLVTGSLVCRHFGLPDHTVNRKNGEKVSYVLRRVITTNGIPTEYGWIDDGNERAWRPLMSGSSLIANEERLPLHSTKVLPQPLSDTPSFQSLKAQNVASANPRTVYYGYIPVSSREKYLTPLKSADAAQMIQDEITSLPSDQQPPDPRLDEVTYGVIVPWYKLLSAKKDQLLPPSKSDPKGPHAPVTLEDASLFILLNLGDFLKNNMIDVFDALVSGSSAQFPQDAAYTARLALLTELLGVTITVSGVSSPLGQAIGQLQTFLSQSQGDEPPDIYNMHDTSITLGDLTYPPPPPLSLLPSPPPPSPPPPTSGPNTLYFMFRAALIENRTDRKLWVQVPPELQDLIKVEPEAGDVYFLRLVYEHAPCNPVLSDPSQTFVFSKFFDPDAPARHIRIELPSIKPKDLRKYKRGVGLQFSPELHSLVGRVNSGMLSSGGLLPPNSGDNTGIAFICSFSIVIVFMVALIVMFIFLILFNIIFWWLPFVRICFPIPTRKSSGT